MCVCQKTALVVLSVLLSASLYVRADVTVQFAAGTSSGWDFHGLATDIARNNIVDLNDLNVIAQNWLQSGCASANNWCSGADIDGSTQVDFLDYALLANDWGKQTGDGVLLQTIYGTAQDANGTITKNSSDPLQNYKGRAIAFNVSQNTALNTATFKVTTTASSQGKPVEIRLYNVTTKNYLLYSGHPTPTTSDPGSGGTKLMDVTYTIPSTIPSHLEGTQACTDMVINFGAMSVTAGDYLLVLDCTQSGSLTTACNFVYGAGTAVTNPMGTYPDGTPLPKCATVTSSAAQGNTYYYYLSTSTATSYKVTSDLYAFQITTCPPVNQAPQVNAGQDQTIINPVNSVNLNGTVTDDNLPNPPGMVTTQWTMTSGPGTVTFGDANAVDTTATFSAYGVYVLRLTASDSVLSSYDEVQITYLETPPPNQAPVVNAGSDQTITMPAAANLTGTVTDDGLPNPPGVTTQTWTKTSGPGTVTFADPNSAVTTASFSQAGTYVLRLTASDSQLSSYDEVTITVNFAANQNEPPTVDAGYNQVVTLGNTITIIGIVTPSNASTSWSKVSGPGTVSFGSPSSATTTVSFSAVGTYDLRLTGTANGFTITDDITVVVQAGNIYYVSTSGSDSANGSSSTPWKTIQHAVDTVSPGDTILVHAGTYIQQIVFNKSGSASGGYIILRNYGSDVPIIDGTGTNQVGIPALITVTHESYICVFGFEMQNMSTTGRDDTPAGVAAWGQCDHIYICGNNIHDVKNATLGGNAHGICFYGDSTTSSNNIWVEDNQVHDCRLGTSESVVFNGNVEIFTVKDNIIHDNDNIGIDFIGGESHGSPDQARTGSCLRNTVYNIDFSKNANFASEGSVKNADGIYSDGAASITIERNIVHNCNLGIEAGCEHHGLSTSNIIVRDNFIYNSDVGGIFFGGYDTSVGSAVSCSFINNSLYNNNVDQQGWGGEIIPQWHCTNNVVKNNVFYGTAGQMLIDNPDATTGSGNVFDYNVYYGTGMTWLWKNTSYTTFAAYKTASGQDSHSLNTDPVYANVTNLDFHLYSGGSPCINAGDPSLDYSNQLDIDGQNRLQGSNVDIGADESK